MGNMCCTRFPGYSPCMSGASTPRGSVEELDASPDGFGIHPQCVTYAWHTVEEAVTYLKQNFRDTSSPKVEDSSRFTKLKLIEAYPHHFGGDIKLSLPHKIDVWTKLPDYRHLGVYIVASRIVDRVRLVRWLVYVDEDEITVVERNNRTHRVKPSAFLVSSANVI